MGACCRGGHLASVLAKEGYLITATDIIDRGYPGTKELDFLNHDSRLGVFDGDIVTNPPYKYAQEFVEKSIKLIPSGYKVAMFLKLTFLEGKRRKEFYKKYPPVRVYVLSERKDCYKNGDFTIKGSKAVAYAWFIWQKGFNGDPVIKWL